MKNKDIFKKYIFTSLLFIIFFTVLFLLMNVCEYLSYQKEINIKISSIIENIDKRYDISKNELMEILTSESGDKNYLKEYGIDLKNDAVIENMTTISTKYIFIEVTIILLLSIFLLLIFRKYNKKNHRDIENTIKLLENINRGFYDIDINKYEEGDLAILTDEIYKTAVKLNEFAENSLKDKINLKNSLSDITHQIKTPLTSILIMLENIEEDKNMDENIKQEFLKSIKRELLKIHFLAKNILKLSELDTNSITFNKRKITVDKLIDRIIENVSTLSDLKNIKINVQNNTKKIIEADFEWQVEALTNILKNAIEHSSNNEEVTITAKENDLFISIEIEDHGTGIDKKDLKHIFDKFYKCSNSTKDSNGIGLALAKSIITASNGSINVKSTKNEGTIFYIKYFLK